MSEISETARRQQRQSYIDDDIDYDRRHQTGQPQTMNSLADGLILAMENISAEAEGKPAQGRDPRFRSSPDRHVMNVQMAIVDYRKRISGYAGADFSAFLDRVYAGIIAAEPLCESPIEKAIVPWLVTGTFSIALAPPLEVFTPADDIPPRSGIYVIPQFKIADFRLDFAVVARKIDTALIVALECDGTEFHGDVKDRRRDAYLAALGIPTVRASGREINEYPKAVVQRVADIVMDWMSRK